VFEEGTTGRNGAGVVVQDIEILAVSSVVLGDSPETAAATNGSRNPTSISSTVTIALTPDEAQLVALAEEFGSLRLTLRRPDDTVQIATHQTELDALVGDLPASAVTTTTDTTGG
jgi:pilus assembly protein CpaB